LFTHIFSFLCLSYFFCVVSPLPQPPLVVKAFGKREVQDHEEEVRGREKKHQGNVVRNQWMWCLRPVFRKRTPGSKRLDQSPVGMCHALQNSCELTALFLSVASRLFLCQASLDDDKN
jgi:hypothetical protein